MSILTGCAVGAAAAFSACSLDVPKSRGSGVRIIIDDPNKNAALAAPLLNSFESLLFRPHLLATNPTATSDFTCFAVNVTGAGIGPDSKQLQGCTSATNMNGVGVGSISKTTPRGTAIEMNVIGGPDRTIDVYGVFPPDKDNCGGTSGSSGGSGGSGSSGNDNGGGYFLGRAVKDLATDTSVTIGISYSGANPDIVCTGGNNGNGGNNQGGGLQLASPFPYGGRASGGWTTQIRGSGMTAGTTIQLIAATGGSGYSCASTPNFVSANEIDCVLPALPVDGYTIKATDGTQVKFSGAQIQMQSSGAFISVDQNTSNTDFGSVANGSTKVISVHFGNAGTVTSGSIGTPNFASSPFSVVSGSCSIPGGTLAQDAQCTADIKFAPVATGPFTVSPSFFGLPITLNGTGI